MQIWAPGGRQQLHSQASTRSSDASGQAACDPPESGGKWNHKFGSIFDILPFPSSFFRCPAFSSPESHTPCPLFLLSPRTPPHALSLPFLPLTLSQTKLRQAHEGKKSGVKGAVQAALPATLSPAEEQQDTGGNSSALFRSRGRCPLSCSSQMRIEKQLIWKNSWLHGEREESGVSQAEDPGASACSFPQMVKLEGVTGASHTLGRQTLSPSPPQGPSPLKGRRRKGRFSELMTGSSSSPVPQPDGWWGA